MTESTEPVRLAPIRFKLLQQAALPALFLLLGVIYASWAARIPAIRDALALNAAQLGIVLLSSGIGAVASFPLAAWLIRTRGGRRSAWLTGVVLLASLPAMSLAPGFASILLAAAVYGAASSSFDVAINAIGADAEKLAGRSIMSALHAWFCVGTVSGALIGSAVAGMGVEPTTHFAAIALLFVAPLYLCYANLDRDELDPHGAERSFAIPHGPAVVLGVICFSGAVAEGSVADWSGVFMKDRLGVGDGVAPLAFAGFAAMMLTARLFGDRLKDSFGARRVICVGALLAAAGIFIAVPAFNTVTTISGFAVAGAGMAALFPFVYSAAARYGSTALAAVATFGYSGNLIGPPIIGFVAHGWGLQTSLAMLGALCLFIAVAASRARALD